MLHTIRLIPASPGRYSVDHDGSTIVTDSVSPITDAAKVLIAGGASPSVPLHVLCAEATIADMPLHRLVAKRPHPPKNLSALTNGVGPTNP